MSHRLQFTIKKLFRMALLLLGVSLTAFLLMDASPLDPLQTNVGQAALGSMSPEQIARLEEYWGVDAPAAERYLNWLGGALRGDFGVSLLYRRPVLEVMGQRLANSLWLLVSAWLLSGALGLALGVAAGANRGRWPDRLVRGYCLAASSTPAFWLALLLLIIFSVWLKVLPIGLSVPIGAEAATLAQRLRHALLPALTLSVTGAAGIALHTREKVIDVLDSDYILFARARGEGHILRRHVLRNVALPAITLQFASIGELIGGSVLVEQVFSYPGLGQAAVAAGLGGDLYGIIKDKNRCYREMLRSGREEEAGRFAASCRELNRALLGAFRKEQDYFVRLNWQDEVLFPQEAVQNNLKCVSKAIECLGTGDVRGALEAVYGIDNNRYAFLFDREVFCYFTEYVLNQPACRLKWGAGRIVRHENLFGLVTGLKDKLGQGTPDLEAERQILVQAANRQELCYRDDIKYMTSCVEKLTRALLACMDLA